MKKIKKLMNKYKIYVLIIIFIAFVAVIVNLPSLAKYKNTNAIYTLTSWDGTIANNYQRGDGTEGNPFIISNGSELAFFVEQLKNTDYEKEYFELSNDIALNPGVFNYDETKGLTYTLEGIEYFVKENTNEYYSNKEYSGEVIGVLNSLSMIENFKGNLNGKSFTIFGTYLNNTINDNLAIFNNLSGNLSNINIINSAVYGKNKVAGIAINSESSKLVNVIYDGFVINKSLSKTSENVLDDFNIIGTSTEAVTTIAVPNISVGLVKSIKLNGKYEINNNESSNTIRINGIDISQTNSFEIDLGTELVSEIQISTMTTVENTKISFSELKYTVEYLDDISSGIMINSKNSSIKNTINKADVYGNYLTTGIVSNVEGALDIVQSYNKGNIKSNYIASGIVGIVKNNEKNVNIKNVYNIGYINSLISSGIVSIFENNTGNINIQNTINKSENYFINTITNSVINVSNSYSLNQLVIANGITNVDIQQTTLENVTTPETLNELAYNQFISHDEMINDESKVWIYKQNKLPELFIENSSNPIANISVNSYSWNQYNTELKTIDITENIVFNIQPTSMIKPIDSYYCIVNSKVPLTEESLNNLNWIEYDEPISIETSGYYIIYAKIVDLDGNITYMNTDLMKFNKSGYVTQIKYNDTVWSNFRTELNNVYTNKDINLSVNAHDDLVFINSIEYYISNKDLTEEELSNIQEWNPYTNNIVINTVGTYVVYVKILDSEGKVTYLNTDYLIFNGYKETLGFGNSDKKYDTNYITDNSSINLTFEGNFEIEYQEGYTHNFISNILLPLGTEITLIDKKNNKVYRKTIDTEEDLYGYNDSCTGKTNCSKYATYSFSSFKEIGSTINNYYDEKNNVGKTLINEEYVITVDFKNTNLIDNYYDLSFYLAIKDSSGNYLYQTLDNTIKNINIYTSIENSDIITNHNLISDYNNQTLNYNNNSEISINFNNQITYTNINDKNIIDTQYEAKKAGLLIKLYNSENNEVNKMYLDNIIFQVGSKDFFASSDNSIKINLGSISNSDIMTLKIKTKPNSSGLKTGNYYIKINKFLSTNGYDYDNLYEDEIIIPIVVDNQVTIIPEHSFDVQMNTESIMLDKKKTEHKVNFNLIYEGTFVEPKLRVSLYEKKNIGAVDQEYVLVDLAEYVKDKEVLTEIETNKYFIDFKNPTFELDIIPKKFDYNGYKYVFELYDGITKIGNFDKYFIVR